MMPYIEYADGIKTTHELIYAVQDVNTAGYECAIEVQPRSDEYSNEYQFYLVLIVTSFYPGGSGIDGIWVFYRNGRLIERREP